jgi:DHA1 family multidrug resistance protein-like MFS transporter
MANSRPETRPSTGSSSSTLAHEHAPVPNAQAHADTAEREMHEEGGDEPQDPPPKGPGDPPTGGPPPPDDHNDPNEVTWDGPDDPTNPMNFS